MIKQFIKDLYYFITCFNDKDVREFYIQTYILLLEELHIERYHWLVFGYLLYLFTSRKIVVEHKVELWKRLPYFRKFKKPGTFVVYVTGMFSGTPKEQHAYLRETKEGFPPKFKYILQRHISIRLLNNKMIFLKHEQS